MLLKRIIPLVAIIIVAMLGCEKECNDDTSDCLCEKDTVFVDVIRVDTILKEPLVDLSEFELIKKGQYSALCAIEIDDEELELIEESGVVWSSSANPDIYINTEGIVVIDSLIEDNEVTISSLDAGSNYYLKAYALTADTLYYSNEINFTTIEPDGTKGTVMDIDGNEYETMIIGGIEWMLENLKVAHYSDGSPIITDVSASAWGNISYGAFGIYDYNKIDGFESDSSVLNAYGALYNWYAVVDDRGLAPDGWHVPTDDEWRQLEITLGMSVSNSLDTDMRGSDQGSQMKITATYPFPQPRWDSGNVATNSSGMSIIPGGARYENGNYGYKGFWGCQWTSTEVGTSDAWDRTFGYHEIKVGRNMSDKNHGFSVRCVKNNLD